MNFLIDQGKALYWGTSEWSADQIMAAVAVARRERLLPPQMEQPQYNMLHRDRVESEYVPLYREIGLGMTTWSPLASGLLTGKYDDLKAPNESRANLEGMEWLRDQLVGDGAASHIDKVKALMDVASDLHCTRAQLAIAWCLKNPNVHSVITGASNPEQIRENMKALDVSERLTHAVMERIERILGNFPER